MIDARTFPTSLDTVRNILLEKRAEFKGDYLIHDTIYRSKNSEEGLEKVFLRLREIPKNIWPDKSIVVVIKNTDIKQVGKQSYIPVKQQFDVKEDALKFIAENYSDTFEYDYEFDRSGEQYFLGEDGIDLEIVEGHPSIEFKSKTEEGLKQLLDLFGVKESEVIQGPSVVEIKKILGKA